MKFSWFTTVIPIAAIFSFRMLGLFMLIPVFTIFAPQLQGATPLWTGMALGAYGLSQGLLQIPFGMLSDSLGRKPVIAAGLVCFALGSLLGAFSESVYTMIIARTLQGMGATGSVLIALMTDLTPENQRTKGMAIIGLTIALSFGLAMLFSPLIAANFGLSGIFHLTTVLAIVGLIIVYKIIPDPPHLPFSLPAETRKARLLSVLSNTHLQRLNISIFCQHGILTATFYAVPLLLQDYINQGFLTQSWYFYTGILLASFAAMLPVLRYAEKRKAMKLVLTVSVVLLVTSQILLYFFSHIWSLFCLFMLVYFMVFNLLEAALPALVSRQAMPTSKGAAMGVYSSSQFLGIFAGGIMAGFLYQYAGVSGIFLGNVIAGLFWLKNARYIEPDASLSILTFPFSGDAHQIMGQLNELAGVDDVALADSEGLIYLLVNKSIYAEGSAENILDG